MDVTNNDIKTGIAGELSANEKADLIRAAVSARANAYAPYSKYKVGAAVMASSGRIFTGVNVENASYPCGICAEANAIAHAAAEGERSILAVAITGGSDKLNDENFNADIIGINISPSTDTQIQGYCTPCGICRQIMREFADPAKLIVISASSETDYREWTLEELLPESFGPNNLAGID